MEVRMRINKHGVFFVVGILILSLLLPAGIKPAFAEGEGPPIHAYPLSSTSTGGTVTVYGLQFDWWVNNNCPVTLETFGTNGKITTDGSCIGFGTLTLPLPAGADYTTCTFYKDGAPQTSGGIFLTADGRIRTFVVAPPPPDGIWSVSCTG
jgi:hypothetical protein